MNSGKEYISTYIMGDNSGNIKIGKSENINKRLQQLSTGNPTIRLLFYADYDIEKELHKKYEKYNCKSIGTEWFHLNEDQINDLVQFYHFHMYDEYEYESFLRFLNEKASNIDITIKNGDESKTIKKII